MAQLTRPLRFETIQDYLAWTQKRTDPGRTELDEGDVLDMAPETLGHIRVKTRVQAALNQAIRVGGLNCEAVGDGIGVKVSERSVFIPDGVVYCGASLPPDTLMIDDPVIVTEVVLPSSGTRDLAEKMPAYFRVPSVMHYLLVHPARRFIVHFRRAEVNAPAARIHYDATIVLEPPGITVKFGDILPEE